ncbi:hypothetical protein AAC387_Pa04g2491 [Persea americana]
MAIVLESILEHTRLYGASKLHIPTEFTASSLSSKTPFVFIASLCQVRTTSPMAFTRAIVVFAVKYSIVERPGKIDDAMENIITSAF